MERFANNASTTLSSGINNSVTSISVASSTGFPSNGDFRIIIDDELLKVTAVSGTTWTVTRGDGGTTADSHSSGSFVTQIITKESVDSIVSVQQSGSEISNRRILNFIGATVADNSGSSRTDITITAGVGIGAASSRSGSPSTGEVYVPTDGLMPSIYDGSVWRPLNYPFATWPPVLSSWTAINQGTSTFTDIPGGGISLIGQIASGDAVRGLTQSVSQPFTITCGFRTAIIAANYIRTGIIIGDGTKFIQFSARYDGYNVANYNSWNNYGSDPLSVGYESVPDIVWLRIVDTSSSRYYQISSDGLYWTTIKSESSGNVFLTANVGGVAVNGNNGNFASIMTLIHWSATSP